MARIYKRTDQIKVKIEDIILYLSPLSQAEKVEAMTAIITGRVKMDVKEATRGMSLAVKYSVKKVDGLTNEDNTPYAVAVDADGHLTDECVDELMNLEMSGRIAQVCSSLANSVPKVFTDSAGNPISGVEIVSSDEKKS